MASKKFTKHAQRVLNHNPNVVRCTEGKIVFTEEFALKVCDALKAGEDPIKVFEENGFSVRILGKSRINGAIGLWRSKYELENLPRRKAEPKPHKEVETAAQRRERELNEAIAACDKYIAEPTSLGLGENPDKDVVTFEAIAKVFASDMKVVVKDLCAHYGYPYSKYYSYQQSKKPAEDAYVNILNPHRKNK